MSIYTLYCFIPRCRYTHCIVLYLDVDIHTVLFYCEHNANLNTYSIRSSVLLLQIITQIELLPLTAVSLTTLSRYRVTYVHVATSPCINVSTTPVLDLMLRWRSTLCSNTLLCHVCTM